MKRKYIVCAVILSVMMTGCGGSQPAAKTSSPSPAVTTSAKSAETAKSSKPFTNKYGTATTKCAHSGCDNYIASSGDTNCCVTHSKKCANCGVYIDEDATYCMDCLKKALS